MSKSKKAEVTSIKIVPHKKKNQDVESHTFEVFRGHDHSPSDSKDYTLEWYWRLRGPDGKLIARCHKSYSKRDKALESIRALQDLIVQGGLVYVAEI